MMQMAFKRWRKFSLRTLCVCVTSPGPAVRRVPNFFVRREELLFLKLTTFAQDESLSTEVIVEQSLGACKFVELGWPTVPPLVDRGAKPAKRN